MARVYKATFMCTDDEGVLVEPGLHYQTDLNALTEEPGPDSVANAIWGQVGANFEQSHSAKLTIHELVVAEQTLPPAIGVAGAHTVAAPGFLPSADTKIPTEMVPLVLWHTATRSRSARGHTFFGSPYSSSFLGPTGVWDASFIAALQGLANACIQSIAMGEPLEGIDLHPIVYSRTRHVRGQSPFTFILTGATVKTTPTWLRSRGTAP